MNTATESLIRKIKALLAKADPRNNATKEEAEEALRKAQELMTRHGIESMDIDQDKDSSSIDHEMYVLSRNQRCDYDNNVSRILSRIFNVGVIFTRVPANDKMCNTYILVGNELDRALAREALPILLKAMTLGVSRHLRERGLKWTAPVGQSYYLGVEQGYIHASEQGKARAYEQAKKHEVDRYALVLVDKKIGRAHV